VFRIERIAEHIAALDQVNLACLLSAALSVVASSAQRCELLERRKRIAATLDRSPMIDHGRRLNSTDLKACLTKRVFLEFVPAQPLPTLR
jgi:hypothetical protein